MPEEEREHRPLTHAERMALSSDPAHYLREARASGRAPYDREASLRAYIKKVHQDLIWKGLHIWNRAGGYCETCKEGVEIVREAEHERINRGLQPGDPGYVDTYAEVQPTDRPQ